MLYFQRIVRNLIGLQSAFLIYQSCRGLKRQSMQSNTKEKRTETRDWVKVSIDELSVFYPKKTEVTLLKKVLRAFQWSRFAFLHQAKLILFFVPAVAAALSYRKMFPLTTSTSLKNIEKLEAFAPVRGRQEDVAHDQERSSIAAAVQAQKVIARNSPPDDQRPKPRQSGTQQPVLDPFKCSPAKNSLLKTQDIVSHTRSRGDLWLVCR